MLLLYENLQNLSLPTFFVNRRLYSIFVNKLMTSYLNAYKRYGMCILRTCFSKMINEVCSRNSGTWHWHSADLNNTEFWHG
jgi:hypothetical protein